MISNKLITRKPGLYGFFFCLIVSLCFIVNSDAYSSALEINPIGPLPTLNPAKSKVIAYYSIHNLSNQNLRGISVKSFPLNTQIDLTQTNCYPSPHAFNLKPGQACTLGLTISGPINPASAEFKNLTVCSAEGLNCTSPSEQNTLKIATMKPAPYSAKVAGTIGPLVNPNLAYYPLAFYNSSTETSWKKSSISYPGKTSVQKQSIPNRIACSENGQSCVMIGDRDPLSLVHSTLLAWYSKDAGVSWIGTPLPNLSKLHDQRVCLNAVFCDKRGEKCMALGDSFTSPKLTNLVYRTADYGHSWTQISIANKPIPARLWNLACDDTMQRCITSGVYKNIDDLDKKGHFGNQPIQMFHTKDGGNTWEVSSLARPERDPNLSNKISTLTCKDDLSHCSAFLNYPTTARTKKNIRALGYHENKAVAYYVSDDGGVSWSNPTKLDPPKLSDSYQIRSIACDASMAFCLAVGNAHFSKITLPLAYTSDNGGVSWSKPIVLAGVNNAYKNILNAISCDKKGAHCIAVGYYSLKGKHPYAEPLIYDIFNQGSSWNLSLDRLPKGQKEQNIYLNAVQLNSALQPEN